MPSILNFHSGFMLLIIIIVSIIVQSYCKKKLGRDRYAYMRDLCMVGVLILCGIWSNYRSIEVLVATAIIAAFFGILQSLYPKRNLSWLYLIGGLFFYIFGSRISFIGMPDGSYMYLSPLSSAIVTTLWMALFPLLFHRLDEIPGLAGHLLGISLMLMLLVTSFSGQDLGEAFFVTLFSSLIVAAFWSRLSHSYRQMGRPISAIWGTMVAGISMLGVSKGVTISALMIIPLGFYALPMIEFSVGIISKRVLTKNVWDPFLYTRALEKGIDHPSAVKRITVICFLLGVFVSLLQLNLLNAKVITVITLALAFFIFSSYVWKKPKGQTSLWGVKIDGISMDYAVSKTLAWLRQEPPKFRMVSTVNAIAMCDARNDPSFKDVVNSSDLILPDGVGLVWGLKALNVQVVERVAGIDYMGKLCRYAAAHKFPIYLLGGKPGVADEAVAALKKIYPSLIISGTRDGYFDRDLSTQIADEIKASGARILFVAMGQPTQEKWIRAQAPHLDGVLCVGVGGSFDVISGKLKRAPKIWQKCGCEWLYRLIQEPWRYKKMLSLIPFVFYIIRDYLGVAPWKESQS